MGAIPKPISVVDWFRLLQTNKFIGLTLLNVFDVLNYALVGLIFLALFAALGKTNKSFVTLAVMLGLLGIAVYFSSNEAFSMLSLSSQYAAATNDAQRSLLLAAGQTMLVNNNPAIFGTSIFMSFILVTMAGLIFSVAMLRSHIFSRVSAYIGIIANVFGLGYFFTLAFVPPLSFIPLSASAPFLLTWYILIGLRLLKIGYQERT